MYDPRSFYHYLSKSVEGLKNSALNWPRICYKKWFTKTIERKYSAMDATIKK